MLVYIQRECCAAGPSSTGRGPADDARGTERRSQPRTRSWKTSTATDGGETGTLRLGASCSGWICPSICRTSTVRSPPSLFFFLFSFSFFFQFRFFSLLLSSLQVFIFFFLRFLFIIILEPRNQHHLPACCQPFTTCRNAVTTCRNAVTTERTAATTLSNAAFMSRGVDPVRRQDHTNLLPDLNPVVGEARGQVR